MNHDRSKSIYIEAQKYIPGGVNSPVRAFRSVGLDPIFIEKAAGSKIYDVDGNVYIDYICSWGPMILGHSHPYMLEGIEEILYKGTSYGVPSWIEVEMAKVIAEAYPSVEMVRMVNSGTEATMSALRLARAYTGRNQILKFEGCYHGHSDALLVKSGSGTITYGVPTSQGVPAEVVKDTLVCIYNDLNAVEIMFEKNPEQIACVIIEPVAGNMGVVGPRDGFLQGLQNLCQKYGALLIFDEVITGFRLAYGGAQEVYGVEADITCFGKIIGGGLPVGAYGGRREVMEMVSPLGPVYQAGTLSGNPLAMHMGYRCLQYLKKHPEIYEELEKKAIVLEQGIWQIIERLELPVRINRVKGMFSVFFAEGPIENYQQAGRSNTEWYSIFFREMLEQGILLPPAQFEGWFVSMAHTSEDIRKTLEACEKALQAVKTHKSLSK